MPIVKNYNPNPLDDDQKKLFMYFLVMSAMAKSQHMVEMDKFSSSETVGVDFLYHVQTNVSVRRGSI